MKTFLKFIITIAIVVGIVFGIIQLVNINRPNDYVYAHIISSNFEKSMQDTINNENIHISLENKIKALEDPAYSSLKTAINENSIYTNLKSIANHNEEIFKYYKKQTALTLTASKDLQNIVIDDMNVVEKAHNEMISKYNILTNYLVDSNKPNVGKVYANYYFEDFIKALNNKEKLYSQLCIDLSNYVLKDVYSGVNNNYQFILNNAAAIMNNNATKKIETVINLDTDEIETITNNIVTECLILNVNYDSYMQEKVNTYKSDLVLNFLNDYKLCDNLNGFFISDNKAEFISSLENNKENYTGVYNYLFIKKAGI